MNVTNLVDDARRWSEGIMHTVRGFAGRDSDSDDPAPAELWSKTSPKLERALAAYDRRSSDSIPESALFGDSKTKCQVDLDNAIDAVILLLERCGASECRKKVRTLQHAVDLSRALVFQYREQSLLAPPEASLSPATLLFRRSRESFEDAIADEVRSIDEMRRQIMLLKEEFRNQLRRISLEVSLDEVDSLLLPVQDDVVSMAAVITNVAGLTAQLGRLVDESKELPAHTRRYYGIYLVLVYAIGRIQAHFIREIDESYLPKLRKFEQAARDNIADARSQISRGGPVEQLAANAEAGKTTVEACNFLADSLRKQRRLIAGEAEYTKRMFEAAANTYRTIQLSLNVAELMSDCQTAFRTLRDLRVPRLRPFQNIALKEELQRLAELMLDKEN